MVGLIEAAHNYAPQEGVTFENYARLRVKGAIIDFLRKSSNLCRGTIKRKQDFDKASRKLEVDFQKTTYVGRSRHRIKYISFRINVMEA